MQTDPTPDQEPGDENAAEHKALDATILDPKHLGHGVHVHSTDVQGMHIEDSALPSSGHTGAGLGGMQIGERRF